MPVVQNKEIEDNGRRFKRDALISKELEEWSKVINSGGTYRTVPDPVLRKKIVKELHKAGWSTGATDNCMVSIEPRSRFFGIYNGMCDGLLSTKNRRSEE
jgi:hypothetical protein